MTERQHRSFAATAKFLATRTVANAHDRLLAHLQPGLTVLDVGCANGSITRSIAEAVGPSGEAFGLDINVQLITEAAHTYANVPNLFFVSGDAYLLPYDAAFDLVTAARLLQWCRHPDRVLAQLKKAVKPGGLVLVLDYNLEKTQWEPALPSAVRRFFRAYLQWRRDHGFNPTVADQLADIMTAAGLENIRVSSRPEVANRQNHHLDHAIELWRIALNKRGDHLVRSGYLWATDFAEAIIQYDRWAATFAQQISMYALAVEGTRPAA